MNEIRIAEPLMSAMTSRLFEAADLETCAVGFLQRGHEGVSLMSGFEKAADDAYVERTSVAAVLQPEYVAAAVAKARAESAGLVFLHTHPNDLQRPSFSRFDDAGERRLATYVEHKLPHSNHAAMVISPGGVTARGLGKGGTIEVRQVGKKLVRLSAFGPHADPLDQFDRQIRAFGLHGQARLAALRVGVVGLGGTGSLTVQQLAYLGISHFTLIDFDTVEQTNLNRLVGATPKDVGVTKLEVAKRAVMAINPDAVVEGMQGDVVDDGVSNALTACDIIVLCTDSHASRAIVSQIGYQYLIPVIDMGVVISVRNDEVAFINGRVQLMAPGLPCLHCMDWLDSEKIRVEMMTPEARAADPYVTGVGVPQPAVISLNGVVSSLAVTMLIGVVTDAPFDARLQIYDAKAGTVRPAVAEVDPNCLICSFHGALARGQSMSLPTRRA